MYHPTSRVLTVLELLQSRPSITGPELATRLEMDVRTVRRYITHLQDVGIPIEANIGRYGGYRLRPGFKLPPLIFTEDEATSIMIGLLASSWLEIKQPSTSIEGALAKVSRVLPLKAKIRLEAMMASLVLLPHHQQKRPDASLLIELSCAIQASQRIEIVYNAQRKESTQRKVEPYGMVGWKGNWYLVGYCCLRLEYRIFRLDRIQQVEVLSETFRKDEGFDYEQFVKDRYQSPGMLVEVEFQTDLATLQQHMTSQYGTLTPTPTGVLFQEDFDDMEAMARYLMAINLPFVVHYPPELRTALQRIGEKMIQFATAQPPQSSNQ
ncbi:helix-turn-helix transcriptional regulator [Tengunoibacter tsumagoiensis]|uniref:Transcriptional regulator n=1 Tax=Tengunoibacter tsumagoiensis TaxID=2014871 RepID=A0A402A8T8_9CHLR|nr:YafY family protein [Tengunoibacter tsumagoiensis]GCE15529.1 transcriptional regulator [Tengunoibacter tsumagoiensis]